MSNGITTIATPTVKASSRPSAFDPLFAQIVFYMRGVLADEVWLDGAECSLEFDWPEEAEATWRGITQDAVEVAELYPRTREDLALHRTAGFITRAVRSKSRAEIDHMVDRSAVLVNEVGDFVSPRVNRLLADVHECFIQMADLADEDLDSGAEHRSYGPLSSTRAA